MSDFSILSTAMSLHKIIIHLLAQGLPGYYFKDDAWNIHEAIRNYVEEYLKLYYGTVLSFERVQSFKIAPRYEMYFRV